MVIPQVETVEQAKHILSSAKFGTEKNGTRSAPPFRLIPGLTDMPLDPTRSLHQCVNDQAAIMIQIETAAGVHNLDAILTECPDIDIVWFGTLDCRVSMNLPGNMGLGGTEAEWLEIVKVFDETMKKHDKPYGGFAFTDPPFGSPERFSAACERMSFITCTADVLHLSMLTHDLVRARGLAADILDKGKNQPRVPVKQPVKENGHVEANGTAA